MKDNIVTSLHDLRLISMDISHEQAREMKLWTRLRKANKKAWTKGCGLAAIQIGIPLRFAWFIFQDKESTLLNPEIILLEDPFINKGEGCLSIPKVWTDVKRYNRIEYISHGKKRKAEGIKAVIIQHEVDHMNGILNIDK